MGVLLMALIAMIWFVYLVPFPLKVGATLLLFGAIALGRLATGSRRAAKRRAEKGAGR